jgi:hypothetical protein
MPDGSSYNGRVAGSNGRDLDKRRTAAIDVEHSPILVNNHSPIYRPDEEEGEV